MSYCLQRKSPAWTLVSGEVCADVQSGSLETRKETLKDSGRALTFVLNTFSWLLKTIA